MIKLLTEMQEDEMLLLSDRLVNKDMYLLHLLICCFYGKNECNIIYIA